MKLLKTLVTVLCTALVGLAFASDKPDDAIAMVDKGLAFMQKNGKDALIKEINGKNPAFINGDTYLVVRSAEGVMLGHPFNQKLIGKNMQELPDADGKYFRKEIVEVARTKGKGWVDFRYNNPVSKEVEKKSSYFVRDGDVILEAGIYKGK